MQDGPAYSHYWLNAGGNLMGPKPNPYSLTLTITLIHSLIRSLV